MTGRIKEYLKAAETANQRHREHLKRLMQIHQITEEDIFQMGNSKYVDFDLVGKTPDTQKNFRRQYIDYLKQMADENEIINLKKAEKETEKPESVSRNSTISSKSFWNKMPSTDKLLLFSSYLRHYAAGGTREPENRFRTDGTL